MIDPRHLVLLMSLASERNAGNGTRNPSCIHPTCFGGAPPCICKHGEALDALLMLLSKSVLFQCTFKEF